MRISRHTLRRAKPEYLQRLARFLGIRVEGKTHGELAYHVSRRTKGKAVAWHGD